MTLDQIKYFLAAAKFQNITMAGRAIYISPSAISTAISRIEEELQCNLFRREGKNIFITDKGKILQQEFENLLDQIELIKTKVSDKNISLQGEFRLGGSHFLAARFLARTWSEIQKKHPDLKGELIGAHTTFILSEVVRGMLDFALCFSPQQHPKFTVQELFKGDLRIVVRKHHPILKLNSIRQFKELSKYTAIIHKPSPGIELCESHPVFSKFGIEPKTRFYFDSDDAAIECIINSDSWTMIPDICYRFYTKTTKLLPVPKQWNAQYNICSVIPHHRIGNPSLKLLEKSIRDLLSNH